MSVFLAETWRGGEIGTTQKTPFSAAVSAAPAPPPFVPSEAGTEYVHAQSLALPFESSMRFSTALDYAKAARLSGTAVPHMPRRFSGGATGGTTVARF
jgi:hypothetical protein